MKKTKNNGYHTGDDSINRLLLSLQRALDEKILSHSLIKEGKWLIELENNSVFLKQFSSHAQLMKQLLLSRMLENKNFEGIIAFHPLHYKKKIIHEGKVFGVMPYIEPSKNKFSYDTDDERKEALSLLQEFHSCTTSFSSQQKRRFPTQNYQQKWKTRHARFIQHIPSLSVYVPTRILTSYAFMGEWSLKNLSRILPAKPDGIIHGDVAHHNFYRDSEHNLRLIDFDLAALAPIMLDYLQWANRVLPSLDWNLDSLWSYEQLQPYQDNREFLIALAYPADVFRECNHFMVSDEKRKKRLWPYIKQLTIEQFNQRKKFFQDIIQTKGK